MESRDHARLGPSSAHRWMTCPASVRVAEALEIEGADTGSVYAAEGTAAHSVAEIYASRAFGLLTPIQADAAMAAWRGTHADSEYDEEEMVKHAQTYVRVLMGPMTQPGATLRLEVRGQSGIEGVWGTSDAVVTDPDVLTVVDYKYGQGVRVDADDNEQLKFYALGAWEADLMGTATTVALIVVQPRLDHVSRWECTVAELLAWREEVARPAAERTKDPDAPFNPSESACRFCPARGQCHAQMKWTTELDFGGLDFFEEEEIGKAIDLMSPEDYATALRILPAVRQWCSDVEEHALTRVYSNGEDIPGWKAVLSGGKRVIPDPAQAIKVLVEAGYKREDVERIPDPTIQTLGVLDKVVGKKILPHILGDQLTMSEGRPSLVPDSDNRPAVTSTDSAVADFAD
jgi:Protein of unknown function (DUF2800)